MESSCKPKSGWKTILVPAWMTGRVAPIAAASKPSDGWIVHPLKSWKREADGEFESVLTQIPSENCSIAGWIHDEAEEFDAMLIHTSWMDYLPSHTSQVDLVDEHFYINSLPTHPRTGGSWSIICSVLPASDIRLTQTASTCIRIGSAWTGSIFADLCLFDSTSRLLPCLYNQEEACSIYCLFHPPSIAIAESNPASCNSK